MRAFEAAGRHLSLSRAAIELNVTQSAVSRQVRLLEEHLGVRLFERLPRSLLLTPKGSQYLEELTDAFALLEEATNRIRERRSAEILRLRVFSTFALRWLIPRLGDFALEYPEIEVQLMTLSPNKPIDLAHDDADAWIRTGFGDWPGMRSDWLVPNQLVPVCAPALRAQLTHLADLQRLTLLHSYARPDDWRKWLSVADADSIDSTRGIKFENSGLMYQAAVDGLGVAIAQAVLVRRDLESGSLVVPFPIVIPAERTYYLVSPLRSEARRLVAFREWILKESRKDNAAISVVPQ
jgi:LysR family glycine cleavage system transcriptional activator